MQIRNISTFQILCCGPEHPKHGSFGGPRASPDSPLSTYRFLKVTQLSEWWLCLGYEFVGRNLTSSVLCGLFAIMYFQRKTTKIAMFRMWGEDTLQFPLRHDLVMMLWPLPWLQQPLAPLSRQEAGWACIHVPEHPLLAAGLNLLVSAQSQPPRPS